RKRLEDLELNSQRTLTSVEPTSTYKNKESSREERSVEQQKAEEPPPPAATARSKRPIYTSERFAVFEWQFNDLSQMLGDHVYEFDLHAFFDALSARSRDA